MRPRERDLDAGDPAPAAAPPAATTRPGANLSSMVVRPSVSGGGGSDYETAEVNHRPPRDSPAAPPLRRRGSPPPSFRRRDSPLGGGFRRRGESPDGFRRRDSSPAFHRRGSPPPSFRPRSERFHDNPSGYLPRVGSISPPRHGHYDLDVDHPVGSRFSRGFRGGRGGGRFRDTSPPYGLGRGGRSFGRGGYDASRRGQSPTDGEYVHRNDPNLSPREGDWICRNPSCGNLNFARRTYCNNCNKYRFGPGDYRPSRSPRRGFFGSPPPHGSLPSLTGPTMDRDIRRDVNGGYRSPPRVWGTEDPRDFVAGSPPPRRGGRFQDHMRRDTRVDYREEDGYRGRSKFDFPVQEEWDRRDRERDGFFPERRGYDRRPPSPRDRWVRESRDRSRSPMGARPLKGSFMGRGRDDQRYDDSFMGRGRADELDMGRGPGFRRADDSFIGRGRGDRRGIGRGARTNDIY